LCASFFYIQRSSSFTTLKKTKKFYKNNNQKTQLGKVPPHWFEWQTGRKTKTDGAGAKGILKQYIDCLRFVLCPLLAPPIPRLFAAAINSTSKINKAGSTLH
jgi:hypothetical protein